MGACQVGREVACAEGWTTACRDNRGADDVADVEGAENVAVDVVGAVVGAVVDAVDAAVVDVDEKSKSFLRLTGFSGQLGLYYDQPFDRFNDNFCKKR